MTNEINNAVKIMNALKDSDFDAILLFDERNILYSTGFLASDSAALISKDKAFLFTDARYIEDAQKKCFAEVESVLCNREQPIIKSISEKVSELGIKILGFEGEHISYQLHKRLIGDIPAELLPADGIIRSLRERKSKDELKSLIEAQRIAERALEDVLLVIKPGIKEREIAAELTYKMLIYGGEGNSFPPICLTGANTSVPHGVPGDTAVSVGDFVTMDFGCVKNGYCSDMTRTVAVGFATDEMKKVYYAVLEAQLAGIKAARPGVTGAAVHKAAADVIEAAGYGEYFTHGFGHGVGLNIHEAPNASPANESPLPEGAVISAEPGIYMPGKFGVRIEDVLYLEKDGNEVITAAPKELIIL